MDFLVRKDQLTEHQVVTVPRDELAPDSAELAIDRFGFTANNITYAAMGAAMAYWSFFPTTAPGWGRIPVWGFGTVVRSTVAALGVGERFYGYFPMSSHVVVQPTRLNDAGFVDAAPHRRERAGVYNQYLRTTRDPSYRADTEPQQVVLRPLFATSFVLADYLAEHRDFGAEAILISSASSKLAVGMAFVCKAEPPRGDRELIGLTSAANAERVRQLGLYDRVVAYDDVASLPPARPSALIDIAGNPATRAAIHRHHGDALRHSLVVGSTHWESRAADGGPAALPGPAPVKFFAPDWFKQRAEQWTPAVLFGRIAEAWNAFLIPVLDPASGLLAIVPSAGPDAVARAYDDMVRGRARADHGHVMTLAADAS
jgi:hypothetical protein